MEGEDCHPPTDPPVPVLILPPVSVPILRLHNTSPAAAHGYHGETIVGTPAQAGVSHNRCLTQRGSKIPDIDRENMPGIVMVLRYAIARFNNQPYARRKQDLARTGVVVACGRRRRAAGKVGILAVRNNAAQRRRAARNRATNGGSAAHPLPYAAIVWQRNARA